MAKREFPFTFGVIDWLKARMEGGRKSNSSQKDDWLAETGTWPELEPLGGCHILCTTLSLSLSLSVQWLSPSWKYKLTFILITIHPQFRFMCTPTPRRLHAAYQRPPAVIIFADRLIIQPITRWNRFQ